MIYFFRNIFLFLIFLGAIVSAFSQGGFKKKHYLQNSITSVCRNVIEAPNGNIVMIGLTLDSVGYFNYLTLLGADASGTVIWRKDYGNINFEHLDNLSSPNGAVLVDGLNFYYAAGVRDGANNYFGVLIKFDFNGDTIWQKIYRETSPNDLTPQGICKSVDGGLLITGFSQTPNTTRCLLLKTDLNGNELWRKMIDKPTIPATHDGKAIVQDSATRKIIIAGYQYIGNATSWDAYSNILILDSLGNKIIQTTFNNAGGAGFSQVIQLKDKNFLTCGGMFIGPNLKAQGLVVKFNLQGSVIWSKQFDTPSTYNEISKVHELASGDILLFGDLDTMQNYSQLPIVKPRIIRINSNGTLKWKKYFGSANSYETSEYPNSIFPMQDGSYLVGVGLPFLTNPKPYRIIKIDSTGCDTTEAYCKSIEVGINPLSDLTGFNFEMYPNPANDVLKIRIDAPGNKQFKVVISDMTGRPIQWADLNSNNNLKINTTSYPAGIYFTTIYYEGRAMETKKIVIVR